MRAERRYQARLRGVGVALAFFALGYLAGADRTAERQSGPDHVAQAVEQVVERAAAFSHAVRNLAGAVARIHTDRDQ